MPGGQVGEAHAVVPLGFRRQRAGRLFALGERVDPLVGPVGEDHRVAEHHPRPAAVLLHPVAHVPRRGQHLDGRAVRALAHERRAALLVRAALGPPDDTVMHVDPPGRDPGRGHRLGRQRGLPTAVLCDLHHAQTLTRPGPGDHRRGGPDHLAITFLTKRVSAWEQTCSNAMFAVGSEVPWLE